MIWERWKYRLLEEPPEGGGDPGGGGEDPPTDPPGSGDPPGDPPAGSTISADVLPEDLRGKSEAEVKFMLEHMVRTYGERNDTVESLRRELSDLRGKVDTPPPPEPDPDDDKPMSELILENPEKALDRWAEQRGYVRAMDDLSSRVGESEFLAVGQQFDDFDEHETKVRDFLQSNKIPANRTNIVGAYKMVLADSILAERAKATRAASASEPPSGAPPPKPASDDADLPPIELEIMRGHGITDPEEWKKYKDAEVTKIQVPTG